MYSTSMTYKKPQQTTNGELNGRKQQFWGCATWDQVVTVLLCVVHIYKLACIDIYICCIGFKRVDWSGLQPPRTFSFFTSRSLFVSISVRHSLSFCVSLSLKAIHIQHNNQYKHLFLFMSLAFARSSSTHANVNTRLVSHEEFLYTTPVNRRNIHIYKAALLSEPLTAKDTTIISIHASVTLNRITFTGSSRHCPLFILLFLCN